jgi:hypothetical protein
MAATMAAYLHIIIDGAIAALGLAQRNSSPRLAGMSVFLFLRRHGLSPRQNGDEFHHQQTALNCLRARLRYAPAHETALSVNSIHWFSDRRAHSMLHINFAASQWAATSDSCVLLPVNRSAERGQRTQISRRVVDQIDRPGAKQDERRHNGDDRGTDHCGASAILEITAA